MPAPAMITRYQWLAIAAYLRRPWPREAVEVDLTLCRPAGTEDDLMSCWGWTREEVSRILEEWRMDSR